MNKILLSILQLRSQFQNSADVGQQILTGLLGDSENVITGTITDGLGKSLSVSGSNDNLVINSIVQNGETVVESQIFDGSLQEYNILINNTLEGKKSFIGDASQIDIKNFIQSSNDGVNMNSMLAGIMDKFSVSSKVKASDLYALINTYNVNEEERRMFINAISSSADADGTVSNYTILQMLNAITSTSKEEVSNGSLSLDDSEVFYLRNFLATAVTSILTTLATVLGMLLTAVNTVIGIIVTAISVVTSAIFNAIVNQANSEVEVSDPLSTTNWFNGPCLVGEFNSKILFNHPFKQSSTYRSDELTVSRIGNLDLCHWPDQECKNVYLNGFFSSNLHRDRAWDYISSIFYVHGVSQVSPEDPFTVQLQGNPYLVNGRIQFPDSCYLTEDEDLVVKSMNQRAISDYLFSCYGATLMLWLANILNTNSTSITCTIDRTSLSSWSANMDWMAAYAADNHKPALYAFAQGLRIYIDVDFNHMHDPSQGWTGSWGNDVLTTAALNLRKLWSRGSLPNNNQYNDWWNPLAISLASRVFEATSAYHFDIVGDIICDNSPFVHELVPHTYDFQYTMIEPTNSIAHLSSLPTDRCFTFAGYSETALVTAAIASSAVVALVLVGASIAKRAFKAYSWKKMIQRKKELSQAKDDWDHGRITTDQLYKAQKKYNFKAKLFGWDSYDASNNWFNAPETPSSDSDQLLDLIALIKG